MCLREHTHEFFDTSSLRASPLLFLLTLDEASTAARCMWHTGMFTFWTMSYRYSYRNL